MVRKRQSSRRKVGVNGLGPDRAWTPEQVEQFVRDARDENEHAWYLIPPLREALVALVFGNVVAQIRVEQLDHPHALIKVGVKEIRNLWLDMYEELKRISD